MNLVKGDLILPSGVSALDRILNGGLSTGLFIQFYGEAASGKTTAALQFVSAACRIGTRTIYINSESSSPIERLEQISGKEFSQIKDRLMILSPKDFEEQSALIDDIELYTRDDTTRLVVIDTLTRLYRAVLDDRKTNYLNHRELNRQAGVLKGLAREKDIAVLVLNQVRGSMDGTEGFEPVASNILDYWSDYILKMRIGRGTGERTLKRLRPESEPSMCRLFLTERGLALEPDRKETMK
ncbi:MAG: ATPase domain-containing protein [Candidatus Thorarchaeota archaeon]|jgi:RecA/RadA recombinase